MSGQVNVASLSAKLNVSDLYNRLPKERVVQVKVPKFKLEYAQELQDVFTKLGRTSLLYYSPHIHILITQGMLQIRINPVLSGLC